MYVRALPVHKSCQCARAVESDEPSIMKEKMATSGAAICVYDPLDVHVSSRNVSLTNSILAITASCVHSIFYASHMIHLHMRISG